MKSKNEAYLIVRFCLLQVVNAAYDPDAGLRVIGQVVDAADAGGAILKSGVFAGSGKEKSIQRRILYRFRQSDKGSFSKSAAVDYCEIVIHGILLASIMFDNLSAYR